MTDNLKLIPHNTNVIFDETNLGILGIASKETGTDNKLYKLITITLQDNEIDENDFESCILSKEILEEIAYSCNELHTNFGFDIHSHTLKNTYPFNTIKIKRIVKS